MVLMNFVHLNRVINELQICIIKLSLIFFLILWHQERKYPIADFEVT